MNKRILQIRNDRTLIFLGIVSIVAVCFLIPTGTNQVKDRIAESHVSLTTELPAFDLVPGTTTTTLGSVEISTSHDPILVDEPPVVTIPPTTIRVSPPTTQESEPVEITDDIWWDLAMCEDGGKNRMYGPFSGYFHFMPETWWGIGYTGYPHQHDYETQKEAAIYLQSLYGWLQWPGCAYKLGLL